MLWDTPLMISSGTSYGLLRIHRHSLPSLIVYECLNDGRSIDVLKRPSRCWSRSGYHIAGHGTPALRTLRASIAHSDAQQANAKFVTHSPDHLNWPWL